MHRAGQKKLHSYLVNSTETQHVVHRENPRSQGQEAQLRQRAISFVRKPRALAVGNFFSYDSSLKKIYKTSYAKSPKGTYNYGEDRAY